MTSRTLATAHAQCVTDKCATDLALAAERGDVRGNGEPVLIQYQLSDNINSVMLYVIKVSLMQNHWQGTWTLKGMGPTVLSHTAHMKGNWHFKCLSLHVGLGESQNCHLPMPLLLAAACLILDRTIPTRISQAHMGRRRG